MPAKFNSIKKEDEIILDDFVNGFLNDFKNRSKNYQILEKLIKNRKHQVIQKLKENIETSLKLYGILINRFQIQFLCDSTISNDLFDSSFFNLIYNLAYSTFVTPNSIVDVQDITLLITHLTSRHINLISLSTDLNLLLDKCFIYLDEPFNITVKQSIGTLIGILLHHLSRSQPAISDISSRLHVYRGKLSQSKDINDLELILNDLIIILQSIHPSSIHDLAFLVLEKWLQVALKLHFIFNHSLIFDIVFNIWVDSFRPVYMQITQLLVESSNKDFLDHVLKSIDALEWTSIKPDIILLVVKKINPSEILSRYENMIELIIKHLSNPNSRKLGSFCGEFISRMLIENKNDTTWIKPIINGICTNDHFLRATIIETVLSRLPVFVYDLLVSNLDGDHYFYIHGKLALIKSFNVNDSITIMKCLRDIDDDLRSDSFGFICNKKSFLVSDFTLIKSFLEFNSCFQGQDFRSKIVGFMFKLITRLNHCKHKNELITDFFDWLIDFCTIGITIGSSFSKTCTCLSFLDLISDSKFQFKLHSSIDTLIALVSNNTYTKLRNHATKLLLKLDFSFSENQISSCVGNITAIKTNLVESGALILGLVFDKNLNDRVILFDSDINFIYNDLSFSQSLVLQMLIEAESRLDVLSRDISKLINSASLHGLFVSLSYIILTKDYSSEN